MGQGNRMTGAKDGLGGNEHGVLYAAGESLTSMPEPEKALTIC